MSIDNSSDFNKFLNKFIRGKGAGPSAWRAEFLLPLLNDNEAMNNLTFILSDFKNGRLPVELNLTFCRLIC